MVSGGSSRSSHFADNGSDINFLVFLDINFGKVSIKGGDLVTVVDNNGVSVGIFGHGNILDAAFFDRFYRVSGEAVKINPGVEESVTLGYPYGFNWILSGFFRCQGCGCFFNHGLFRFGIGKHVRGYKRGRDKDNRQVGTQDSSYVFVFKNVSEIAGHLISAASVFDRL